MSGDLNEIMAEIVAVLQKHDVGGSVTLLDEERCMYRIHLPTWSLAQPSHDGFVRVRSRRSDFASEKDQQEAQLATANLIFGLNVVAKHVLAMTDPIRSSMAERWGIEITNEAHFIPVRSN